MLPLEIGSPAFYLVQLIFDAQSALLILAVSIGKFRGNLVKFEAFDMQEFKNMPLFQFHLSDAFPFLMTYISAMPAILSRGNPILSQSASIFRGD
jgi:hypothetical protein